MSPPSKQDKSPPANFLTLPREVRQKILSSSFHESCEIDVQFSAHINVLDHALEVKRGLVFFLPHVHDQASSLASLHPVITEDLNYVLRKVLADFDEAFDAVWDRVFRSKHARFRVLASTVAFGDYLNEDIEVLQQRKFSMVQDMRTAVGVEAAQFSFGVEEMDT